MGRGLAGLPVAQKASIHRCRDYGMTLTDGGESSARPTASPDAGRNDVGDIKARQWPPAERRGAAKDPKELRCGGEGCGRTSLLRFAGTSPWRDLSFRDSQVWEQAPGPVSRFPWPLRAETKIRVGPGAVQESASTTFRAFRPVIPRSADSTGDKSMWTTGKTRIEGPRRGFRMCYPRFDHTFGAATPRPNCRSITMHRR